MTNLIQQGIQNLMSWVYSGKLMDALEAESMSRKRDLSDLIAYYEGHQRRPLRTSPTGKDYNVMANLTGVIVNRSVSMLIGPGVDFNIEDDASKQTVDNIWQANRGDILLHDLAQFGGIYGTPFLKIIPDGRTWKGKTYPRLVALNPYNMIIQTAPDDIENVLTYVNRWNDGDTAWREVTSKAEGYWTIQLQKADDGTKGLWVNEGAAVTWEYPFAPIAHTKNMPLAGNVYGMSDIEAIIELQDRYNAAQSDINVILGNNAFPLRYTSGGKLPRVKLKDGSEVVDISPSKIIEFQDKDAKMNTVEMQSDLSSSRSFASDIRRDMFDMTATVDSETLRQNASNITNFGLHVMYKDELAMARTKQMLYGDLLTTINANLLTMAGQANPDAGEVTWGDPLPTNPIEEITALKEDIALGLVSVKTASQIRNYDYDVEQAQIAEEKRAKDALGGNLLRDFLANKNQVK